VNLISAVLFMVGIILIGLGITNYLPTMKEPILLAGIIVAGGGLALSSLFREEV